MAHGLHPMMQMMVGFLSLGILLCPIVLAAGVDLDRRDGDAIETP